MQCFSDPNCSMPFTVMSDARSLNSSRSVVSEGVSLSVARAYMSVSQSSLPLMPSVRRGLLVNGGGGVF